MSDQGDRPGLRLDDARVDVDFKRRRRMSHNEYDGYGYERSLLHRVVAGAGTPDQPQCEQERAEHNLEPQETERVEQIEETRAIGDLRRRPQLAPVERAPGRLAAGWDALGEGVIAGASIRRFGAAVAVLVPLALIAVVIAGQLSAGSPRRAVRAAAPVARHAPAVRAPGRVPQTSRSRRVARTRRSSATAGRHRPSVPSRRRSPPASTAVQARYTPPSNRALPARYTPPVSAPVAPSAPYQAPSPAPVQVAPRNQPSAPQSTSHPSSPHPWGPGGSLGPGHSPDS